MRTLILSDLHLGQRPGHDVLRRAPALDRLLVALEDVDRLVLLGDIVELHSRFAGRRAMEVAAPVLRAIGGRLHRDAEIVYVPGNHDAVTVRPWVRHRGGALEVAEAVPSDTSPELIAVVAALAPARIRVSYPGVWLRDDVWATHGHYLDRHLIPETTFGLLRDRPARARPGSARPADYERARRRRRRRQREGFWARARERPLAIVLETVAEMTRYGTGMLHDLHLTGVTSRAIDLQMRRAAVPAMAVVAKRLGLAAAAGTAIFGHVHRLGPLAAEVWQPEGEGTTRLLNTGSWVYEPLLLDDEGPGHPYWPGGAVMLQDGAPPQALGLLRDLHRRELIGRAR